MARQRQDGGGEGRVWLKLQSKHGIFVRYLRISIYICVFVSGSLELRLVMHDNADCVVELFSSNLRVFNFCMFFQSEMP